MNEKHLLLPQRRKPKGALAQQNAKRRRLEESQTTQETEEIHESQGTEVTTGPGPEQDTHALILRLLRQHYNNFSEEKQAELKSVINNPRSS